MNWLECCECLKRINPGETCWSVNVHMETPGEGGTIEVIEATGVLVYCEACASMRDFDQIVVPFK